MNMNQTLPDFFSQFKDIVFKADTKNSLEERKKYLSENENKFRIGLTALLESKNYISLGAMLKIIDQFDLKSTVSFLNVPQSYTLCYNFEKNKNEINERHATITFKRASELYKNAKENKKTKKYLDRHRFLETAIRLVWELFPADTSSIWPYSDLKEKTICHFIAKCYLLRSKLALPKGSDIPEKKIEAIQKAWEWFTKYDCEAEDLKIEIALEKARWEKNLPEDWIKMFLDDLFLKLKFNSSNSIHRAAFDKACDSGIDLSKYFDDILQLSPTGDDLYLSLYQVKTAKRKKDSDLKTRLKQAASALSGVPLSYPLWNDTIDFIKVAKNEKINGWDNAAIKAWRICMQEESKLKLGIQVRWYWSRQAELYDLAFTAAIFQNNPVLAAQAADSLKSRPAVKMIQAENSLNKKDKENLKKLREIETNFAAGNFHAKLESAKQWNSHSPIEKSDILDIPQGWTAIHFHIALNSTAYVILMDNKGKNEIHKIETENVWKAYRNWKIPVKKAKDMDKLSETNQDLKVLCKACGDMLKPVIDRVDNENIIIIPHGFFHLVPIHAALIDNDPLFTIKHCLFLPAWSLTPKKNKRNKSKESLLYTNWAEEEDYNDFINSDAWTNQKKIHCSPEDYLNRFNSADNAPPSLLTFYCHGQGNYMNPYSSSLKMHGGVLSHQAIIQETEKKAFAGTKVILTACESDLTSGNNDISDEHLSLASAFLQKGASEVCGTLFKCSSDIAKKIIIESIAKPGISLFETVHTVQRKWLTNKPDELYKTAAFRVIGFPENSEEA